MTTIPASELVQVSPSVLAAGGSSREITAVMLTTSTQPPIGAVPSFADALSVSDYFGASSQEASLASIYFTGFDGASKLPDTLLFAQYPNSAVAAYLRGGDVSGLTLANLQALSGLLQLVVDGSTHAANVNLSAATSFSSAASIIQTALNAGVSVTGSIDANVVTGHIDPNSVTASIAGTTMTVSAVGSGALAPGQTVSGTSVVAGTTIIAQLTGTAGSTGTYQVSISQTVASTTIISSGATLTVSAVTTGTLGVGQTLTGSGVSAGTKITNLLTGTGGTGKYAVDISQTVGSETITASGGTLDVSAVSSGVLAVGDVIAGAGVTVGNTITALITGTGTTGTYFVSVGDTVASETITVSGAGVVASYDSVSGGFVIASSTTGAASTMSFATGSLSASVMLTSATGAVLSQGAAAAAPAAFMNSLISLTTDWVNFMTTFDPDVSGSANKQAFAAWKDTALGGNRFGYVCWDLDVTPTTTLPATSSLGHVLAGNDDSGTCLLEGDPALGWDATTAPQLAAFVCGAAASINFDETAGRITFAYKAQAGFAATVSTATIANNLGGNPQSSSRGNGYNFYGAYGAANASFVWFQRGFCTGPFAWFDSYINQIWLNSGFQNDLLVLQQNARSIPYNVAGDALIESALADRIAAGLNFGVFAPGAISASQIAQVNAAAGVNIADTLQTEGSYLQIKPASSSARAARTTPPCTFWYLDRGSVQAITLDSVALQ